MELVSVRGTEFSQGLRAFWGRGLVGMEPVGIQRALLRPPCFWELVLSHCVSLDKSLYLSECCLAG